MFERTAGFRIFFWLTVTIIGIFVFFPIYWMVNTSFKSPGELLNSDFIPLKPTLQHYIDAIKDKQLRIYFQNSAITSIISSLLATIVSAYAAYSFSKFKYRGKKTFMMLIMISKMLPYAILLISIYSLMRAYGLLDSYFSLIFAYITFTLPVGTWTLKTFFDEIPNELMEAAKIDGASQLRTFHSIIFPLAIPGMIAVSVLGFVTSWNDLLYALTLVTDPAKRTLAPGLVFRYLGESSSDYGGMMAASTLISLPAAFVFLFVQRFFIRGLTAGSVKG
ncbi:carbohydrate ABC transporter permease [Paenibacillus sp. HB172176]|uniref:carbohydrate ABC transporter permease n=1 Tax=Paenibacillus sp. HB172176 TaxID=2493690 RepID=UPI001438F95A|nr:carbohydrate ABC transporter permease [Paenibacillus sp. HB172176]